MRDSYGARVDVVVIGAGQAGLAAAYHLRRARLAPRGPGRPPAVGGFVVLDDAPAPGGAWQHRWDWLRMQDAHGVHELPGAPMPAVDPGERASVAVSRYFAAYERELALPVLRPTRVRAVRDVGGPGGLLAVETEHAEWLTRAVVNATGTWQQPFWPAYPGRETFAGEQLHSRDFRSAADFRGRHVVVVGGGTSAVQLLLQLAPVTSTTWVTRRQPEFLARPFDEEWGRAAVAMVDERTRAGLPPRSVVGVTGLPLTEQYRRGIDDGVLAPLPMFDRIEPDGVAWVPQVARPWAPDRPVPAHLHADVLLWATGFRAGLGHLSPLGLRGRGGGIVMDGPQVVADPRIQLVGYGPSASTIGAGRAGREAVRNLRRLLAL
ncbi:NAD(P)-binding domain-containing protein [Pengzhenrongella frigida]|uniref:Pyridine nucleotide-disulfide oxidoreductase n=1 Tax=Pengzhenrongella frigida TaxID=1259133 RepID=A0A4Q5MVF4_9MICO|nr:NAD(P)-binding domain-containing protein [Cellulomonas sp. HLT2-17]RYV49582.1 pyridine nucleotide-disulfide oxidoreductase [Cellulomonas sp. HLT2-17]